MKKSIVQWCKEQAAQEKELKLLWSGGNDSGWVHFELDGEDLDNEYTRALSDKMDDELNYGSWAGDFSASGEATYDPVTNSFTGTDYYGEDENEVLDTNIVIQVPKSFWFNTLHVECEANYDEEAEVSVRFLVTNGFLTDQHTDFCSNLENNLAVELNHIFANFQSVDGYEFRGCTDSWILERKDAKEEGDMLVFTINKMDLQVMSSEDRTVVLELNEELVETIDDRLNDTEDAN
jgi:hypothetical protein